MERLTFDGNFCDIAQCRELPCPYNNACTQRQVWEKLKAYEDLGLEPEAYKKALVPETVVQMAASILGVTPEWMHDVVQLAKENRLVAVKESLGVHDDDKR